MSDRKYRQRGYQDEPREPRREQAPAPKKEYTPRGQPPDRPKTFNMPGFREAVRCARCGNELMAATAWSPEGTCARCGSDLHTCAQCGYFDTSATYECQRPIRRAGLAEGREEHLWGVRAEDHRRTRDEVGRADERTEGVRRPVQVSRAGSAAVAGELRAPDLLALLLMPLAIEPCRSAAARSASAPATRARRPPRRRWRRAAAGAGCLAQAHRFAFDQHAAVDRLYRQ